MSRIRDFAMKQKEYNDLMEASHNGLHEDVKFLHAKILELQNSPGEVTPEDQAMLDELQAKSDGLARWFADLDKLTPPVVPVE